MADVHAVAIRSLGNASQGRLPKRLLPQIQRTLRSDSKRARELRQTSPFVGVVTEQERRRIIETVEERR